MKISFAKSALKKFQKFQKNEYEKYKTIIQEIADMEEGHYKHESVKLMKYEDKGKFYRPN